MDMFFLAGIGVPVTELDDEILFCEKCGKQLDSVCFDDDRTYCEPCINEHLADLTATAVRYAEAQCKITGHLPKYDHTCTPEQYRAWCRHNCTNYEDLIKPLKRYTTRTDEVLHSAIRDRSDILVDDAIEEGELLDD